MLSGAKVAICSEINTKHINRVRQNVISLNVILLVHYVTSRLEKVNILRAVKQRRLQ
jgi:hypothetical protein